MKILKTLAGAVLCLTILGYSATELRAQARPSPYTNDVAIGLLGLLQSPGLLSLQYEFKGSSTTSWVIRAYLPKQYLGYSGFGIGGAYRFFIIDSRALTGLSVAPAADIIFLNNGTTSRSANEIQVGGDIAYKWIFGQFSVEPEAFVRIGFGSSQGPSQYSTTNVGIEVLLGIAF